MYKYSSTVNQMIILFVICDEKMIYFDILNNKYNVDLKYIDGYNTPNWLMDTMGTMIQRYNGYDGYDDKIKIVDVYMHIAKHINEE